MRLKLRGAVVAATLLQLGCGSPTSETHWAPLAAKTLPPPSDQSVDAHWARVAADVPGGFAGLFVEPTPTTSAGGTTRNRLVVLLVHPDLWPEARQVLGTRLDYEASLPFLAIDSARVLGARWDFAQLYAANVYLRQRLPEGMNGVTSADIDERGNRLVYGVRSDEARTIVRSRIESLGTPPGLAVVQTEARACTSEMVPAMRVWIYDAESRIPLMRGAWLILRNDTFVDSTEGTADWQDYPLEAGNDRHGVVDVVVRRAGYAEWSQLGVHVESDGCHPKTVELKALLRRP